VICAVALTIGISINLLSIGEIKMSLQKNQSSKAYYLANLCAEEALIRLKENINYSGDDTIDIGDGSCQILPIENNWTVKTEGSYAGQIVKIKITVAQVEPNTIINSWQQVAEF